MVNIRLISWQCGVLYEGADIADHRAMAGLSEKCAVLVSMLVQMVGGNWDEIRVIFEYGEGAFEGRSRWITKVEQCGVSTLLRPLARPHLVQVRPRLFTDPALWAYKVVYHLMLRAKQSLNGLLSDCKRRMEFKQLALVGCVGCGLETGCWCDGCRRAHCTRCDEDYGLCWECRA